MKILTSICLHCLFSVHKLCVKLACMIGFRNQYLPIITELYHLDRLCQNSTIWGGGK